MTEPVVHCVVENSIATITLDSPSNRNALSRQLIADLGTALDRAEQPDVRVIVLTHTSNTFSAGADLKERREGPVDSTPMVAIFKRLMQARQPVIAAVHGAVRAGGVGLMAACDLIVVPRSTDFAFTEVRIGATPAMIAVPILRRCVPGQLVTSFLTGAPFSATHAQAIGLVTHVVDDPDVDAQVRDLCDAVLATAPNAVAETKGILLSVPGEPIDAAFERMRQLSEAMFTRDEAREGLLAFSEKRPPVWTAPTQVPDNNR